jgi:exodeoxyribonuclease-3
MIHGASRPGHSLASMSRVSVSHVEWHKPRRSRHAFLEVVVGDDALRVFGLHLSAVHSAWSERQRLLEMQSLLTSIEAHQHGFHLVVGDFNTIAPGERLDMTKLPFRLRPFIWMSLGRIRWKTIQTILDRGYADAYRQHHAGEAGMTFPTWDPHVRLDYAFVPSAFVARVRACDVLGGDKARAASDHFPLLVDVDTAGRR